MPQNINLYDKSNIILKYNTSYSTVIVAILKLHSLRHHKYRITATTVVLYYTAAFTNYKIPGVVLFSTPNIITNLAKCSGQIVLWVLQYIVTWLSYKTSFKIIVLKHVLLLLFYIFLLFQVTTHSLRLPSSDISAICSELGIKGYTYYLLDFDTELDFSNKIR